jgi:nucleotide-binding universal stress UspA family protein
MTLILILLIVVLAAGLAVLAATHLNYRVRRPSKVPVTGPRRILFPFVANALSQRALDAALRLASAEEATVVPVFLATVSLDLPLDASLPRQCGIAIPMQEAIEQRAAKFGVPVDTRIERGRNHRHALRQTIANERFDRIVIAATARGGDGFDTNDVAWLLDHAPGEIVVLRPSADEQIHVNARRWTSAVGWPTTRSRRPHRQQSRERHRLTVSGTLRDHK